MALSSWTNSIPPHSSLSLNHHLCTDDTQLFSHSILVTLIQLSPTSRPLCNIFPPECLLIFLHLTLLSLIFSLLVSNSHFLKQTTLHSIPLIPHATFFLSLMNILLSLIRSHHFLSPAVLLSETSAVSVLTSIPKQPVPSLPLLSTLTWLL